MLDFTGTVDARTCVTHANCWAPETSRRHPDCGSRSRSPRRRKTGRGQRNNAPRIKRPT